MWRCSLYSDASVSRLQCTVLRSLLLTIFSVEQPHGSRHLRSVWPPYCDQLQYSVHCVIVLTLCPPRCYQLQYTVHFVIVLRRNGAAYKRSCRRVRGAIAEDADGGPQHVHGYLQGTGSATFHAILACRREHRLVQCGINVLLRLRHVMNRHLRKQVWLG
jgi:hypothetical protein